MAADDHTKELKDIIDKGAVNIVQNYFNLLDRVDTFMSMSNMNVQQISEAAGISEWMLYRRKKKPELWTKEELIRLFTHLDIQLDADPNQSKSESKSTLEPSTPFLGPRAEAKTISDFRSEKFALGNDGYPIEKTREVVRQYFASVKESIIKEIDNWTLLITVPSGSGENTMPILFGKELATETGATLLPEGFISKLHKGEAKLNLPLEARVHDPIRYEILNSAQLKTIASAYRKVVIVDDLLNSGESSIRLRNTLEQSGIKVHAFANLVSVENRQPSPADLERVYKKICDLANLQLSEKLKLKADMTAVFLDYTKQKLNIAERTIRDQKTAMTAFKVISKAATLENKPSKNHDQNLSL